MSPEHLRSKAFRQAILRSESYRILGFLYLLAALVVYSVMRGIVLNHYPLLVAQLSLLGFTIAYEGYMYVSVKKAIATTTELPGWKWSLSVLIESQIPTFGIFLVVESELMNPYQALVGPSLLIYFLFIILSTLRLQPVMSLVMGIMAAIGYLGVTFYTLASIDESITASVPRNIFPVYAVLIVLSGAAAAFVAAQIRGHVAAALREAELQSELERVSHDLNVARSIQRGLLPIDPPGMDGFEVAGWNEPADETGGDYFDWQELPDGRIAISLADATGHGIGPALVSVSCRAYARATMLGESNDDGVLGRLNSLLAEDLESNRFVTFAVIFLDPKSSRVQVFSAGHGPMLWYRHETDTVEYLEAQGIPLGMMDGFDYDSATEGTLGQGDFLALVTDGFFEWENPVGEDFGIPRMEAVLREARHLPAEEMIKKLRTAVEDFCGGTKQMDDLTAVILKRKRPLA